MPTPAEYAANRLKLVNNSGPTQGRTPEGKARSSMNALRHGLTARVVVLPTEDMDASIEDGMLGLGHFEAAGNFDCPSPEIHSAIRLLKTQQMKGEFVYASAEIAAESARRDRLQDSLLAEKAGFNLDAYLSVAPAILSPVGFPSFTTAISESDAA